MSMSTSNTRGTYYPSDQKIKNTRVLITKINQLSTQPWLQCCLLCTIQFIRHPVDTVRVLSKYFKYALEPVSILYVLTCFNTKSDVSSSSDKRATWRAI